jgi:outer membrane protein assembly factor BamB
MKPRSLFLVPAALLALTLPILASDWPQWRGPDRNDVSKETGLLRSWPKEGPKVLWRYEDAGIGYSGPAIVGDRLYSLGARDKKEYVFALDVNSGKEIWSTPVAASTSKDHGAGPRSTPAVDGDLLFGLGDDGDLVCVQITDGKIVWQKNLMKNFGGRMMSGWGYSESPLVDGDQLVCTPGGSKGTLLALEKKTGNLIWQSKEFTDTAGYSSIVVSNAGGVRQYVQMTGASVAGVEPKDGKLLWRFARTSGTAAVPTPDCRDDFVYVTSGYGAGCALVEVHAQGQKLKAEQVYANKNMTNHHGGVVLLGDYLYGYSDSNNWICQNLKTGEIVWKSNKLGKGSVTYADGRLYCYSEKDGTLALVEASPAGWKESGRFQIPQPARRPGWVWTHPVVANGRLYLRDQNLLLCYDVKDHSAE